MPDVHAGAHAPTGYRSRRFSVCIAALAVSALAAASCGKKGPPLPPLLNVPVAPRNVTAKRAGDQVTIQFTIPQTNQSGVHPANIERVEVYAWTPPEAGAAAPASGAAAVAGGAGAPPSRAPGRAPGSGDAATAGPPGGRGGAGRQGGGGRGEGSASGGPRGGEVALTPEDIVKHAKLVATVQVRKPPPPPPERKEGEPPPPPPPPPTGPGLDQGDVAVVTDTITPADREPLVLEKKQPKPPKPPKRAKREITLTPPDVGPPLPPLPARVYVVVGVNRHGKRGQLSPRLRVPLWDPPPAPADVTATVREGAVDLAWTRPDGLRRPLVTNLAPTPLAARPGPRGAGAGAPGTAGTDPGTAASAGTTAGVVSGDATSGSPAQATSTPAARPVDEDDEDAAEADAAARRDAAVNAGAQARSMAAQGGAPEAVTQTPADAAAPATAAAASTLPAALDPAAVGTLASRVLYPWPATGAGFVVYEVQPSDATLKDVPPPPALQPFPRVLTPAPQPAASFTDPRLEYGSTRCYAVRTSETVGNMSVESGASPPVCVSAKDVFAPAAPKSLGAVSSEGAISLIWEGNTEADLAGYIILRGVNGGPLQPITPSPIRETTFRDTAVRRGTRYTYAVVAIDNAKPQNRSAESNRVEETAR